MLLLVGYVGEPMCDFCCVFPLGEFCLFPDFGVDVVENLFPDFSKFTFCEVYEGACRMVKEFILMVF